MAKFEFKMGDWVNGNLKTFQNASKDLTPVMKLSLYEGANVVAKAVRAAADKHGNLGEGVKVATHRQIADGVDTVVFFGGYDSDETAFAIKANVLENGRSDPRQGIVKATHFMRKAVKSCEAEAEARMKATFDETMGKILKGE